MTDDPFKEAVRAAKERKEWASLSGAQSGTEVWRDTMADKNPNVVAVWGHTGDSYMHVFCTNGDIYRLKIDPTSGTIDSKKVHELFHDEAVPQPADSQ